MTNNVSKRCVELGEYIIETKSTVRKTGEHFGISKSTVHIDVTKRLNQISPSLAKQVNEILQENKSVRHIRGGNATRNKYLNMKND